MGPNIPYLGIMGLEFQKTIIKFEISTPKFDKNEFLTHALNFDVGFAFSKGLESTTSEPSNQGPSPLCNALMCRQLIIGFFGKLLLSLISSDKSDSVLDYLI